MSRLNLGNVSNHSVHNVLFSCLLSRNKKIKIYKTVILPALCGYETWSLTLIEEHRLRVFYNMMLRRILVLKREEVIEAS
jgi:hypothetical protein